MFEISLVHAIPAKVRLVEEVIRGLVDIIIYKRIDLISRSIKDFYEFWTILEKHNVVFVSATESF